MLDLVDRPQSSIIHRLKEPKESTLKELKERMITMTPQTENIMTKQNIEKNHVKSLVFRSTIEMKMSLKSINSVLSWRKKRTG